MNTLKVTLISVKELKDEKGRGLEDGKHDIWCRTTLDADQEVPAATDTWYLKYRFYFEDYHKQSNLYRVWWSTEVRFLHTRPDHLCWP